MNSLWTTSLTGTQFKMLLEQQWQTNPDGTVPSRPYQQLALSRNISYTYDAAMPGFCTFVGTVPSADFARRSAAVMNSTPAEVSRGDAVTLEVSRLDMASLGSPVNRSMGTVFTDSAGTVTPLGSIPVVGGAATVHLRVPSACGCR